MFNSRQANAAACSPPSTTYGTVTETVSIPSTSTYYVWSRMAADSTADNSYMLQLAPSSGTTYCYTVGSSTAKSVPVYASGTSTHFNNDSSNWLDTDTTGTVIAPSLAAGTYTVTMIGISPNLALDRLIFTQDSTCTPTGTGDNCMPAPDTTPPVVSITSPANNTTISTVTTVTANATDNVAVSKVEFYVDGTLESTDTTGDANNNYTWSLNPASFSSGSHTLTAKAYDTSGNTDTSNSVTFTVGSGSSFIGADINEDHVVNLLDFSILASNYGKTAAQASNPRADINGDGTVNLLDFSILASNYGKTD